MRANASIPEADGIAIIHKGKVVGKTKPGHVTKVYHVAYKRPVITHEKMSEAEEHAASLVQTGPSPATVTKVIPTHKPHVPVLPPLPKTS